MLGSDNWAERMLGVAMIESFDHDKWKDLAKPVADRETDPLVKQFASAVVEFADNPASTQAPATQPTDENGASAISAGQ